MPRGCALSHGAVLANCHAAMERYDFRPGDVTVAWLPLHHDMGLMVSVLAPVYGMLASRMMSAKRFLMRPLSWLDQLVGIDRVHTCTPNFALGMALRRADKYSPGPSAFAGVRNIVCGAEPIDPNLVRKFLTKFSEFGLAPSAFQASYGMAETTVFASSAAGGLVTSKDAKFQASGPQQAIAREHVSVGVPSSDTEIRIFDDEDKELGEGQAGEIRIRSPSLMSGYYNNPSATQLKLRDGWLRSGDSGFVLGGELFVIGRRDDMMIIGGANIFPNDVEFAIAEATGLERRRVGVFSVEGTYSTGGLVVVAECQVSTNAGAIKKQIAEACVSECGTIPLNILLCKSGQLPKTTSGKLRRRELKRLYLSDGLEAAGAVVASESLQSL